jgi:hypothetical protein
MSEILNKLNKYLTEMAAGKKMDVGRAVQILDRLLDPKLGAKFETPRKGAKVQKGTKELIKLTVDGLKNTLKMYPLVEKAKTPEELLATVAAIIDENPAMERFSVPNAWAKDIESDLLTMQNNLASAIHHLQRNEIASAAKKLGKSKEEIISMAKNNSDNKEVKKVMNSSLKQVIDAEEKEYKDVEAILAKYRKTAEYKKKYAELVSTDPKKLGQDRVEKSKGRFLNSDTLNPKKVGMYLDDMKKSDRAGIPEAITSIMEIISILWGEHSAYQDAPDAASEKAILDASKYVDAIAKDLKTQADKAFSGFGLPRGSVKKAPSKPATKPAKAPATKKRVLKGVITKK